MHQRFFSVPISSINSDVRLRRGAQRLLSLSAYTVSEGSMF